MTKTESPQKPAKLVFPPWSPLVAVIILVASFFGAALIGELLVMAVAGATGSSLEGSDSTTIQFLAVFITYGLMTTIIYLFVRNQKISVAALGLVRPRLKDVGIALLAIFPYVLGYAVLLGILQTLFPALDAEQEQQLGFEPTRSAIGLTLTFISLVLLPPLVEEFVVRGFLFTSFLGRYKFVIAALLTSIVFGAAHLQFGSGEPLLWVAAIDTFILSLVLCYMRYKTGSLWPGIVLHGMKNGLAFTLLFLAPIWGFDIASLLHAF